jgi:hypothetical protein
MKDMKLSPQEAKTELQPTEIPKPNYPYGLSISLETESLKKLGLAIKDFEIGKQMKFEALAVVSSISKNESLANNGHECVSLQITGLDFGNDAEGDLANKLYDKAE